MRVQQRAMSGLVSVVKLLPPPAPCRASLPPLAGRRKYRHPGGGDLVYPRRRVVPPPTPPAPPHEDVRVHQQVQTELYLEELWRCPRAEDAACQTDPFLQRPCSPVYMPVKTGVDVHTQILPGELFNFDVEVVPVLEVLAHKTMEQALIEVLEEEEMAELRAQQRRFLAARDAEIAERQRLEDQERRLRQEADRRVDEAREARRLQAEAWARVAAATLARRHLRNLLPSALRGLADAGVLADDVRADLQDGFLPWLMERVEERLGASTLGSTVLDDVLNDVLTEQRRLYSETQTRHRSTRDHKDQEPMTPPTDVSSPELLNAQTPPATPEDEVHTEPSSAGLTDSHERSSDPEVTAGTRAVPDNNRHFNAILEEPEDMEDE